MSFLLEARRTFRRIRGTPRELARMLAALRASRHTKLVGYDKAHPVFSDVFERHPPQGFRYYQRTRIRWLRPLDRVVCRRLAIFHGDGSSPPGPDISVPIALECEGNPLAATLADPRVRHVFVKSNWAGRVLLANGGATLLRPAIPVPAPASERRRRDAEPVLLAVGYGGMVKAFDVVARIFHALREEFPVRLLIAGTFGHNFEHYPEITREAFARGDFPGLERRLRADSRVIIRTVSRRQLLEEIYPSASVYLHLSRMETFGYSVLEAMANGLPVVATRVNALPEMVRHGETGYVVDPGDVDINSEEWADRVYEGALAATRALLRDPALRERLALAGRQRVQEAFSVSWRQRELKRVYDAILAGSTSFPPAP